MEKKAKINDKMYDVCELEEYQKHASRYLAGHTAIIKDGYLYPVLSPNQKTNVQNTMLIIHSDT